MSVVEWPPGSGRRATYTAAEQAWLAPFLDAALAHPSGSPEREAACAEVEAFHEMKVSFGADLTLIEDASHNE